MKLLHHDYCELYKYKKYANYISIYIKVKIQETSKYDLSYMRYYIVIVIRELIIIFWTIKWPQMKKLSTTKF